MQFAVVHAHVGLISCRHYDAFLSLVCQVASDAIAINCDNTNDVMDHNHNRRCYQFSIV